MYASGTRSGNESGQGLAPLIEALDDKSRALLWYLWWHGHAGIAELRELINASSDFDVLHRLRENINGRAQQLWGKPVVRFEQAKVDPVSGRKVLFRWWFLDHENVAIADNSKPLVDVFSEKDSVSVMAQLPTSVDLNQADMQTKNGILKVSLKRRSDGARRGKEEQRRRHRG